MSADNGTVASPPYVGFGSFRNYIGELAATTIPPRIDPTMMEGKSGGTIAALRVAFHFFGLIEDDGTVTDRLRRLVGAHGDPDKWRQVLATMVNECYAPIVSGVPLDNGTPGQLAEAFAEYADSLSASTRGKAISFYLRAAKDAGLELSPNFKTPRTSSASNGRKRRKKKAAMPKTTEADAPQVPSGEGSDALADKVLAKLPDFDGTWDKEVQEKWFAALDHVVSALKD